MATISFFRPLVIDTDEAARILIELAESDCNAPEKNYEDVYKQLESGLASLKKRYSH